MDILIATKNNDIKKVKYLLKTNYDINIQDDDGNTSLMIASENNDINIINLLLEHKSEVNIQNERGYTALMIAVTKNFESVIDLLIKAKADLDITTNIGNTALLLAIKKENINIVKKLIKGNANVNIQNNIGNSSLMLACEQDNKEIVDILLETKIDVNLQNNKGNTALLIASYNNNEDIIRKLINANANVNIKNNNGKNALNVTNNINIISLLEPLSKTKSLETIAFSNTLPIKENINSCFDVSMYDYYNINDFVKEDYDNIIFIFKNQTYCWNRKYAKHLKIFYPCLYINVITLNIRPSNILNTEGYANLSSPYYAIDFGTKFCISELSFRFIMASNYNYYYLEEDNKIQNTVSKDIVFGGSLVSGWHCGDGTGISVYKIGTCGDKCSSTTLSKEYKQLLESKTIEEYKHYEKSIEDKINEEKEEEKNRLIENLNTDFDKEIDELKQNNIEITDDIRKQVLNRVKIKYNYEIYKLDECEDDYYYGKLTYILYKQQNKEIKDYIFYKIKTNYNKITKKEMKMNDKIKLFIKNRLLLNSQYY
jgi:ankyrin repeat protein